MAMTHTPIWGLRHRAVSHSSACLYVQIGVCLPITLSLCAICDMRTRATGIDISATLPACWCYAWLGSDGGRV